MNMGYAMVGPQMGQQNHALPRRQGEMVDIIIFQLRVQYLNFHL